MNRVLLGVAVAVLAIGIGQASAVSFPTLNETFEGYPTGAPLPAPWVGADMGYSVAGGYSTNATSVAKVTERVTSPGAQLTDSVGINSGLVYLDFDIADQGTAHAEKLYLRNTLGNALTELYVIPSGGGTAFTVGFGATNIINPMNPNQWYHVKLTMDLDNDTLGAAVDGSPVFSGVTIANYPLQVIGFTAYKAGDFGSGATYWDNLAITPEPATVALLALGSLWIIRRRRSA